MTMATAYLSLGSNIGDSKTLLKEAIERLSQYGTIHKISSLYRTEPISDVQQDWFLNCVVKLETILSPQELLQKILSIENTFERIRTVKNGPRTMDIDILLYDEKIISEADITIPHPRMHERRFVLVPLAEIASDCVHSVFKKTIAMLLIETRDQSVLENIGNLVMPI